MGHYVFPATDPDLPTNAAAAVAAAARPRDVMREFHETYAQTMRGRNPLAACPTAATIIERAALPEAAAGDGATSDGEDRARAVLSEPGGVQRAAVQGRMHGRASRRHHHRHGRRHSRSKGGGRDGSAARGLQRTHTWRLGAAVPRCPSAMRRLWPRAVTPHAAESSELRASFERLSAREASGQAALGTAHRGALAEEHMHAPVIDAGADDGMKPASVGKTEAPSGLLARDDAAQNAFDLLEAADDAARAAILAGGTLRGPSHARSGSGSLADDASGTSVPCEYLVHRERHACMTPLVRVPALVARSWQVAGRQWLQGPVCAKPETAAWRGACGCQTAKSTCAGQHGAQCWP